ncbi:hypothetical protein HY994_00315 [Candidatus Micrarchaeota archaeon]|nr:hypothetical protein [Candidatus Micrarchaeota archaeon]
MKPHTHNLDVASSPTNVANGPSTRNELEQRLTQINTQMASFTPDGFQMPETFAAAMSERLKAQKLVQPDTEVLRQLLLEKAQIAETLASMPHESRGLQLSKTEYSITIKKTKLG